MYVASCFKRKKLFFIVKGCRTVRAYTQISEEKIKDKPQQARGPSVRCRSQVSSAAYRHIETITLDSGAAVIWVTVAGQQINIRAPSGPALWCILVIVWGKACRKEQREVWVTAVFPGLVRILTWSSDVPSESVTGVAPGTASWLQQQPRI